MSIEGLYEVLFPFSGLLFLVFNFLFVFIYFRTEGPTIGILFKILFGNYGSLKERVMSYFFRLSVFFFIVSFVFYSIESVSDK